MMNKQEIERLLSLDDFSEVYKKADTIKRQIYGDNIYIRAILEFSNHCKLDCKYCGLNCNNKNIERYRVSLDEMISIANKAHEAGYKTIVLQSGEDKFYTAKILGDVVKEIKKTGIAVTLSCGELKYEEYKHLKDCGADRYLLKHECSDPAIYADLHGISKFENRIECLRNIKKLGYELGSGFMIGLPNQSISTIADDILLLKELKCDMAGIGPFIPHPQTQLKDQKSGSTELTKRAVALARILFGEINLPATTSLGVLNNNEKNDIFSCGANVIMKKVTPEPYKSLYEIYPSKLTKTDILKDRKELEAQIRELSCVPV